LSGPNLPSTFVWTPASIGLGEDRSEASELASTALGPGRPARETLQQQGIAGRVDSMPCVEWFAGQDDSYQQEVFPAHVRSRVSVEAGVAPGWRGFAGDGGECVSLEHFGESADYQTLYKEFGFTAGHVVTAAEPSLARARAR
jgi:transketolase